MLEYKIIKYTAKIGSKELEFTPWTAKHEREYLGLIEKNPEEITDKKIYNILLKPCIDKNIVLSSNEQKLLMMEIRKVSIGETFTDKIECSKCKEEYDATINIADITNFTEANWKTIEIEDLKIELGDIATNKEKEQLDTTKGIVNYIFTEFMLHVKSIEINGEKHDKFTLKELSKFMDTLPTKIFDVIFESYQEQADDLITEYSSKCPLCSHEETIAYNNIPGFLWV